MGHEVLYPTAVFGVLLAFTNARPWYNPLERPAPNFDPGEIVTSQALACEMLLIWRRDRWYEVRLERR